VWRTGYGPRLRDYGIEYFGQYGTDQIAECVRLLNYDNSTRRAVISLFDPMDDYHESKDIPCNLNLHFLIRDGKLHLSVFQRSSDIWWGFSGINMFEWSVLMQMMAHWTGTEVGNMAYFITSFHLYEPMFKRANEVLYDNQRWLEGETKYTCLKYAPKFVTSFEYFDVELQLVFDMETKLREHEDGIALEYVDVIMDPFLKICAQMLYLYHAYKDGFPYIVLAGILNTMEQSDLRQAAIDYLDRVMTKT
jgi:hypothetical protein